MNNNKQNRESNKPKENLKQRAYLNSVTSILDYGANLVKTLVVTPFLVSGLGTSLFGIWKILEQFTSYTNLADIRVTEVLKWAVSRDRTTLNDQELREYVTASFVLMSVILPVIMITGAFIIWYSPYITGVDTDNYNVIRYAATILFTSIVTNKAFGIFGSILTGMNLNYRRMGFRATIILIGGGLEILVIFLGYGIIGLAVVNLLVSISIGTTIYIIVKREVKWFGFGKLKKEKSLSFFKTSGWFMSWTFIQTVLLNSDKVLLGYLAGPAVVTNYVITQYMVRAFQGVVGNVIRGTLPGIGKMFGEKEFQTLVIAREKVNQLTWIVVATSGVVILMFNESFVHLWVGSENYAGNIATLLILLVSAQYIFIRNDSSIISISLDIKDKVILGGISAGISVAGIFMLVPKYGIIGLCIAIITGRLLLTFGFPYIVFKKIGKITRTTFLRPFIGTFIVWSFFYLVIDPILIENWVYLILGSIIVALLFVAFSFYTIISKEQRKDLIKIIKSIKVFKKG